MLEFECIDNSEFLTNVQKIYLKELFNQKEWEKICEENNFQYEVINFKRSLYA